MESSLSITPLGQRPVYFQKERREGVKWKTEIEMTGTAGVISSCRIECLSIVQFFLLQLAPLVQVVVVVADVVD